MISIVIPALSEEKLLPLCLDSLRNQDYQGLYEIIVADNGSTDGTARIAERFGARVVSCSEKKSVFYARQIGADAAQGDIIAQADADTIYPKNWLSRIASQFDRRLKTVAVTGKFRYTQPPWWAKVEYAGRTGLNWITSFVFGRPLIISGATFAFRRNVFLKLGEYHGIQYAADQWGIAGRLSKAGKITFDNHLCVTTSPRSVDKPLLRILKEALINWSRWGNYLIKMPISFIKRLTSTPSSKKHVALVAGSVLLGLAMFLLVDGYFIPSSQVFGKVYAAAKEPDKVVALTFDDGPNEPYTSEVLSVLNSYKIKATFFIIGKNAELYPDVVKNIIAQGDVVGNHTYSHNANHALSDEGIKDIERGELAIFNVAGVKPHLYRPPHGKKSPWELEGIRDAGLIDVTWDDSANDQHKVADFGTPTPQSYAAGIIKDAKPGSIILLHDGYGTLHTTAKADKSLTVQALPIIIAQLQAKGYTFVTVPELLNVPAYNK